MDKINKYVDVTNISLTSDAVSFSDKLSVNIKLTDIELFKLDSARTLVKENLEIELYNKTINN